MEAQTDMEQVVSVMRAAFGLGKTFSFTPFGVSMLPTIQGGKDTVTLTPCDKPAKYDIVLYRRRNGQYVLHRIVGTMYKRFILCGDNQKTLEYPVPADSILAKVICIDGAQGHIDCLTDTAYQKKCRRHANRLVWRRIRLFLAYPIKKLCKVS